MTQGRVREILDYDPASGQFVWKSGRGSRLDTKYAGLPAFTSVDSKGYKTAVIDGRRYRAHRIAWLWMTGDYPDCDIDHVNKDRQDNRFCNLRKATRSQNKANVGLRSDNASGYKGVSWRKDRKKWQAMIVHCGRTIYLGQFQRLENAALAYNFAAVELFGEYASLNLGSDK